MTEATELLKEALSELERLGLVFEAACVRRDLAIAYNLLERFEEAGVLIADARAFFGNHSQPVEVARCDLVIGSRLRQLTRYQEALHVLECACQVFESAGWVIERAKTLYMMSLVYVEIRAYDKALSCLQTAEPVFLSNDLPLRTAYCNKEQGSLLWRLGRLGEGRAHLEEAQAWFERQSIPRDAADCLLNLGNVAYVKGDYSLARDMYEQARSYYERYGLHIFAARCDQNLGFVHWQQGQLSAALDRLHRAADALERRGVYVWAADCHHKMAELYAILRQQETALLHLECARQYYAQEGVALSEVRCEVLRAQIIGKQGDCDESLHMLRRAQRVAATAGSPRYVGLCDRLIGDLMLEHGNLIEAIHQYETARTHFAATGAVADEACCLIGLGQAYVQSNRLDCAESALLAALQITQGVLPGLSWRAHAELGHIAYTRGNNREALGYYWSAFDALRAIRLTLPEAELAGGFAVSCQSVYDQGIHLALNQGEYREALAVTQESKSLVLERMVRSTTPTEATDPYVSSLHDREAELRAAIVSLQQSLCSLENHEDPSPRSADSATDALIKLRAHRSDHRRVLQQLYAAANGRLEPVDAFKWERFRATAQAVLPEGWSVLVYHWLARQLIIFYGNSQDVQVYVREPGPVDRAALAMCTSPAAERHSLVFGGYLYGDVPPSSVGLKYRRLLYELLIPDEVARSLSSDKPLLIVPHGCLHHLPFEALESEAGFLAEQAIVSRIPSLAVLEGLLQRCVHNGDEQDERDSALLVGIDTFRKPKPSLRWTLKEVDKLAAIYGEKSDCLRNEEATTKKLQSWSGEGLLSRYALLHFASHTYLDATSSMLSGITLWDADLTPGEIGRLRLSQAVVILSACQTGLSEIHPGDEIMSLPYAFLAAGARTVVVSLWHVEDESTTDLMAAFHRCLHEKVSPAMALARVQREAIQQNRVPFQWGAFNVVGIP